MSYIELKNIEKSFENKKVLKDVSLSIEKGEFVTFLGSSGCGKTTLLRCLVGLENVDSGSIYLDGQDITHVSAQMRGVSMIFQQYCLFPTMNLFDNVSFGLKMKKIPRKEIEERVNDVMTIVDMQDHLDKYPYQLSGGEQQRAALARGLIMNPKVLLLDEPFSAIDAKLRKELQLYLKKIHRKLNMTSVFVTHDQEEAMRMSDTIHLFHDGVLEQTGKPNDIYLHPNSVYAAGFIGSYNLIPEELLSKTNKKTCRRYAIRPEVIEMSKKVYVQSDEYEYLEGIITNQIAQGSVARTVITINSNIEISADSISQENFSYQIGEYVYLKVPKKDIVKLSR